MIRGACRLWPLLLLCSGCKRSTEPAWAFDPIHLEPDADGVHGFHTWEIFGEKWDRKQSDRHYLCAVVVELWGSPTECSDCAHAWTVQAEVIETDCAGELGNDPLFVSLQRVGIGDAVADPDAPYPGQTSIGLADYGYDWEDHGWAYPAALDEGGSAADSEWDGAQPFALWPTYAWPL